MPSKTSSDTYFADTAGCISVITQKGSEEEEYYLLNVCFDRVNPAIVTVSWASTPSTEPMPYSMLTGLVPGDVKDEDLLESYLGVSEEHTRH